MDGMSAFPVNYSTLEEKEFDELSADEDEAEGASEPEADDAENSQAAEGEMLYRRRFDAWLVQQLAKNEARMELIHVLHSRLQVGSECVSTQSSARSYAVDFVLAGMECHYEQHSQADPLSAAWGISESGDSVGLLPNVRAELSLDGESLAGCRVFATAADRSSRWADEPRLAERFGTETMEKMGGLATLLQFLGAICADGGAPCYAAALPFGLPEALTVIGAWGAEAAEEVAAASPAAAGYGGGEAPRKPPKPAKSDSGSLPKQARATGSIRKPSPRPPEDLSKPAAPRPKPRSSSQSRKS